MRDDRSAKRPIPRAQHTRFDGRVLGGFCLAHEIASGGMAAVYLAHRAQHARIGQAAAVKVIHPHLARDEDFVEMFLDEARIASCITHPNVCRVLDFGIADGTYYLAMEYVMGETLADVLARLSTSPDAETIQAPLLSQIIAQACEGLHAAHEACDAQGKSLNIVHRDISPQNIMVGYDGSVRVLDFGVASASDRLHSTRNGKIKGRLAYMAPEQMGGLPLDRRADLWSLGVVLWEGLSNRRLFKRDDEAATIMAVTRDPVPSLADCGRTVPKSLQQIVARALMRNRESRYATARDLGLALSRSATSTLPRAGMPEVSVWMQSLFRDRIERKRALLRDAADAAEANARPAAPIAPAAPDTRLGDEAGDTRIAVPRLLPRPAPSRGALRATGRRLGRRALFTLVTMLCLAVPQPCRAPAAGRIPGHVSVPKQASIAAAISSAAPPVPVPLPAQPAEVAPSTAAVLPEQPSADEAPLPAADLAARKLQGAMVAVVAASGWADVYLGTRKLGTTPLRTWLPAGVRYLRLVPFARGPGLLRRVAVNAGRTMQLKVLIE